jgi:hypothetical protein
MQTHVSTLVTFGIPALALAVIALGLNAVRRAAPAALPRASLIVAAWVALFGALAASGLLAQFDRRPPPIVFMMAATIFGGILLGRSALVGRIVQTVPLWALVLAQSFRLPLELVMHQAALERVMPNALSFSGYNFDIVTGATAIVVALALRTGAPRKLAFAWSVLGSACLVAIAVIAIVTSPMLAALGPHEVNTWVARLPFVYLPTVLVTFAIAGHFAVFRALELQVADQAGAHTSAA